MNSSSGRPFVQAVSYDTFFMRLCKQSSKLEDVLYAPYTSPNIWWGRSNYEAGDGRASSTYGEEERCIQGFGGEI
jgi:hypothetical protein